MIRDKKDVGGLHIEEDQGLYQPVYDKKKDNILQLSRDYADIADH